VTKLASDVDSHAHIEDRVQGDILSDGGAVLALEPGSDVRDVMTTQYRRGERHVYRHVAGEHLLIALHGDSLEPLFALTPTAALLWKRLENWCTTEELAEALVQEYDVTDEQAATDVQEFLGQLEEVRAVTRREERP
jgi:Coenzyme PQQ synthesis protein D (PqqD)